ncbi:Holliday junction resolvase RuvX [Natronospirillum operosum]|uniref:Putative pre-16S rRNA nuclease n=1 Tax=Natronospirillum operosum TaxID=2759953 RepID=A0A4Z0W733_9GAMM|nr:Holliday junction resolvase RuvX [Natronospirillum operosum]TGG90329.1 Holliday junction resolvase RuvX [Natronospirillum operosum]
MAAFRLLIFDFGLRRTGVAVGQSITGTASPLAPLPMRDGQPDWTQVEKLLAEWRPDGVLVGLPLNMDGSPSEMSRRADKFRKRLHGRFGLPALAWDERLTSQEIKQQAREHGITDFGTHSVDSEAACLIFHSWFEALPEPEDWRSHHQTLPPAE